MNNQEKPNRKVIDDVSRKITRQEKRTHAHLGNPGFKLSMLGTEKKQKEIEETTGVGKREIAYRQRGRTTKKKGGGIGVVLCLQRRD